jgi:hypothetical protein
MHSKSERGLRALAKEACNKYGEDAWEVYRDEAVARYSREDDGDREAYNAQATEIFNDVVKSGGPHAW